MTHISLTLVAHALGLNRVSDMAQKVGLHWPPPPPISARNLVMLAGGQVSPLNWLPANPFAILIDEGQDVWHAGRVMDLLALDTGALVVGTDSGGVWLVEGNDRAIPLSEGWDTPDISCLAFGPDGPRHIFAGTDNASMAVAAGNELGQAVPYSVALFETDTATPFPLLNWRPVPLTPVSPDGAIVGTIVRIVVLKESRRIVLACLNGVFWSPIPALGNAYNWHQVPNLPPGGYSGLALGPNDRIVIAAWGSNPSNFLYGIFYADWGPGGLTPIRATLSPYKSFIRLAHALGSNRVSGMAEKVGLHWPPPPPISVRNLVKLAGGRVSFAASAMGRTSLASSAQDPRVMYAVSAQTLWPYKSLILLADALGSNRVSEMAQKVGLHWPPPPPISVRNLVKLAGTRVTQPDLTVYAVLASSDGGETWTQVTIPNFDVPFHQGNFNNCLAVSPFNSEVVALGWQKHFVSRDSGVSWQLFDDKAGLPGLHDDVHAVHFDPTSPPNERLYVCSDGGVALTVDQGKSFATHMNKNLLNMQLFRGKLSASSQTPGLIAGATQDNGNVYAMIGDNTTPWTMMEGGDGGLTMFVGTGQLLHYNADSGQTSLLVAQWDGTKFIGEGLVFPDILSSPVCAIVNAPLKRNSAGQLMWAIAAGDAAGTGVYGIFADNDGFGIHYELLGQIPGGLAPINALGSADGRTVFVGIGGQMKAGGLIFAINTDQGTIQQSTVVPLKNPSQGDPGASVDRIVAQSSALAFAILSNSGSRAGQNFILRWDGAGWNALGVGKGLPGDPFMALEATNPRPLFTLFAATDKQVFQSDDNGDTWQVQTGGLPVRPHCQDLRFGIDATGARLLYLSTFGRSVWQTRLDG